MFLTLTVSAEVWAETYSWTCSGTTVFSTSGSSLNGVTWKATTSGSSQGTGVSGEKCVQIAKNTGLTLETTGFNNKNIASISIQTWGSQGNTFYLKDGNTQLKSTTIPTSYTSNGAKISFSNVGVIGTKLVFNWASATKAFNVRSITITYEDAVPSCSKPTVGPTLQSVTATENSIKATISISSIGGCNITENGLVYSTTNSTPTVGGSGCTKVTTTACGSTAANKTVTITGLTCGQSYYIRGYATNEAGISYTNVTIKSTSDCPKYTVTLMDDTDNPLSQTSAGGSVTLPERAGCIGYTFKGWTKSWKEEQEVWTTTAPTIIPAGSYTPTANESLYPVYTKTEGGGTSYQFQKVTALSQIKAGGTFIITNGSYYLPNAQASSSGPVKADMVAVTNGVVTGAVTDAMKWTFSAADANGKITIKSAANSNYYLYTTNSNGGLRVNNTSDTWTFEEYTVSKILGFAMKSTSNSRYCAVYTDGSDWRSYTTKNAANYETNSGRLDLYKYTEISSNTTYYISVPDCDPCNALQAPNVTATATANSITLSWAAVSGATSYNIYNYTTEETDETTNLTYTFNGLDPNTEYEWEVEAVSTTCNGKGKKGTTTTLNACEQLGVATDLTVETDYVHTDGKTYVKFNWTPADNTKNNAASQKLCFGKVGEAGTCVDDLANNITWTGDEVSKLEPGTYWWSIQALGDGVKYCDGDAKEGTNFTIIAYNIIIDSNIQYGKVTTDLTQAVVDKTVTLTATPDKGYQFSSWIVTRDGGGTVEVTNNKFTMPASNVTVSATFEALPKLTTPTNLSVSDISCSGATLAWSAVAGASKYELRLTNTSTSNTTTSYPTTNSAYLTLAAGTTYSWTVQAIGDGLTYNSSEVATGEDFTLHYTITYNENGGSIVEDDCGTTLPSELPTTTKSHYTFIGWYMDKELNTPATAGAKLTQNTTLYAKWEEIKFTITWSINENTTNSQELQEGTTITPPADLEAATYACEDKVFVGWVGASIDGSTNEEPDFITDFGNVKENKTYYAVFATPSGDGFTLGQSGDFTIYANVDGTNYYATGTIGATNNGKIVGTTEEGDANVYTFTAISGNNESYTYNIKQGDDYIKFVKKSNGDATTDLATTDTEYTWTISPGAKGTWRVAAEMAGRAIIFRSDSKLFGGYATSNFTQNQSTYYDIEIGGATTYTEYVTSCVTCEKVLTISKGNEENGTFTLDKVGEQETCDGLSVLVTPDPAEYYHVASVTASTGETAVNNGDGTYTITYLANSTGESNINVVFEEDTKYTVTWMVNGLPYTIGAPSTTVYAGEHVATLPTPPEPNAYCGDVFVGWTTENPVSGNFNEAPTVYNEQSAFPPATGDQTFYAVFADYDEQQ